MKNKNLTIAYWAVVVVMLAVGTVGWYWRITAGHQMANYGELIVWGLWIAMYIYFIGLSAGSFLIASLTYVFGIERFRPIARLALFTALISLMVGLLHTWFDLGHMGRFLELYTRPSFSSMMSLMVWMYTIYAILVVVMLWYEARQDFIRWGGKSGLTGSLSKLLAFGSKDLSVESRQRDSKVVKVLGIIGVVLTITFGGGEGALFGVVAARPAWHSGLLPILFLVSALASSAGLFLMIYAFVAPNRGTQAHRSLVSDLGLLTLGLVLLDVL